MGVDIKTFKDSFALAEVFNISRGSKTHADVLRVEISKDGFIGQGECVPYARYGETLDSVEAQIKSLDGLTDRQALQTELTAGAARNAVDCALWDLEAKTQNQTAWQYAQINEPQPLVTAFTLSLDTPSKMKESAKRNQTRPLLKVKLGGENDLQCLEAIREGAPEAQIIIDANEGWDETAWLALQPDLKDLEIALVEQPLPANADEALRDHEHLVPLCADESCHTSKGMEDLVGKYDILNLKLDKTGGLTEAFIAKNKALELGFGLMVGCMVGTSLAMAPAILLAQGVAFVDLDGPLLLAQDRRNALYYDGSIVHPSSPNLWG